MIGFRLSHASDDYLSGEYRRRIIRRCFQLPPALLFDITIKIPPRHESARHAILQPPASIAVFESDKHMPNSRYAAAAACSDVSLMYGCPR
jgi:hypothetical protein